jgi:NAD(P)-dependent dehydrogenase (short-subunit alcohol dehydrogenase family)
MPTILITGASSGIGAACVDRFLQAGWQVIATMRQPQASTLPPHANLTLLPLDVTQPTSITAAVQQAQTLTNRLDVLLNNAGYGLVGPLELATPEQLTAQFTTNVFGPVWLMQAVLPWMRQHRHGLIVNVASIGGRTAFPMYSLYHGTKWALEGISESLSYELNAFNIRVKLIEPGPIKTAFYQRSMAVTGDPGGLEASPYAGYASRVLANIAGFGQQAPGPEVVADVVWRAVHDTSPTLRYPVNTMSSLWARRLLPESLYRQVIRWLTKG